MQIVLTSIHPILYIAIVIILMIIVFIIYKTYVGEKQRTALLKNELEKAKSSKEQEHNKLLELTQEIDLHREELSAQTEHLMDLNDQLEKLSLVASKTDNSVIIADGEGKFIWVNQGFENLYEYTFDEFKRQVGDNIYKSSTKKNIQSLINEAFKDKRALNYNSRVYTKSGSIKWVKTTLNPIFDEGGNFRQFIIIDTDITKLKIANDKLKKLSLVASKSSNSVAIYSSTGVLDWVNEGFKKMYGLTSKEFVEKYGDKIDDFIALNNKEKLLNELKNCKEELRFIASIVNNEGKTIWKQTIITPVYEKELEYYVVVENDFTRLKEAEQGIQIEKEKADRLLLNILPEETSEELKSKGKATPRFYRSVSVLFADIQDFTKLAEDMTPSELVDALQIYFSQFDDAVGRYYVEKIKTMGDAFLCVGGIPMRNKSHPFDTVLVGLELQRIMKELAKKREENGYRGWQLRVGIHSGSVVAGVVGKQKMTYDIWGDSVNIAKRVESACVPGMVNISSPTYDIIKDYFECEHRGKILAKHKGHIDMYFVHRIKSEFSEKGEGIIPNHYFKEMLAKL